MCVWQELLGGALGHGDTAHEAGDALEASLTMGSCLQLGPGCLPVASQAEVLSDDMWITGVVTFSTAGKLPCTSLGTVSGGRAHRVSGGTRTRAPAATPCPPRRDAALPGQHLQTPGCARELTAISQTLIQMTYGPGIWSAWVWGVKGSEVFFSGGCSQTRKEPGARMGGGMCDTATPVSSAGPGRGGRHQGHLGARSGSLPGGAPGLQP